MLEKRKIFDKRRKIVITYNERLKQRQEKTFNEKIKKIKDEIKEIYKKNKNRKDLEEIIEKKLNEEYIFHSKAKRYVKVGIKDGKITIERNRKECDIKKLSFGKTILFTSLLNLDYEKVIGYYKGKNRIEKVFKLLNNDVKFTPVGHYTDSKIRVHAFICVIALLLVKMLEYIAKKEDINLRSEQIIEELRAIKEAIMIYPNKKSRKESNGVNKCNSEETF